MDFDLGTCSIRLIDEQMIRDIIPVFVAIAEALRGASVSYSVFSATMADLTFQQVEKAAQQKLPILFPVAVIEEHGPHMCLGGDAHAGRKSSD